MAPRRRPTRIPGLRAARFLPWRRRREEVDEEFAFHLDMRAAELAAARGLSPDEARREALRQFGDVDDARAYCRLMDDRRERRTMRIEWMDGLRQDASFAARALRRTPGFTAVVVLTLALGIGANVAMLGIVDRLLLRPPAGVRDPERVRRLYFTVLRDGKDDTDPQISYPAYAALRQGMTSARGVAAYYSPKLPLDVGDGAPRPARVALASASYFPTLGVRPAAGRFFVAEEDAPPAGARVAVLSDELRRRTIGGAPADAVGRTVTIAGERFLVIGVAPPGFTGADLEPVDAWVPLASLAELVVGRYVKEPWTEARNVGWLRAVARVGDGEEATARATSEAAAAYRRSLVARRGEARADSLRPRAALEPLLIERGPERTPSARIALWLAGMSAVVLLIACANVANLLLARALRRRREIAVRVALGAGRRRLVAQLLTEGMLLAGLGGAGALLVAWWGGGLVRRILLPDVAWSDSPLEPRTLAVAAAVTLAAGLLSALVPALQTGTMELVGALKAGAREGGGRRLTTRSALVVVQAALSVVLLAGAGLFVRSLRNARAVDLGFAADDVLTVNADFAGAGYSGAETPALHDRLFERVAALPGVAHAALAVTTPFSTTLDVTIRLPGRDSIPLPASGAPRINAVTPDYFATMGTRIVAGRGFTPHDRKGSEPVMVVNETMARTLWPGRSPLGECVMIPDEVHLGCVQVVGVARDVRWNALRGEQPMQMYTVLGQGVFDFPLRVLFVRAAGDRAAVARQVAAAVREVAPRVPFADLQPLSRNLERETRPWRLGATVFTAFGALALLLAALGLYGVVAYDVAQRTAEMGVRLALGARASDVVRLVVAQGVRVATIGVALGTVGALVGGRWVGSLLFDTRPNDPLVLGGVAAALIAVAVAASLVPAWRATRVAPGVALRAE